jgi:hypothetical protein
VGALGYGGCQTTNQKNWLGLHWPMKRSVPKRKGPRKARKRALAFKFTEMLSRLNSIILLFVAIQ